MEVSWIDIINDDAGADQDADHIVLPPQFSVEVKSNPSLRREITHRFDEDNPEQIIRTERTYEIVNIKKKISNAAIQRKKQWVKFGSCKNQPKGIRYVVFTAWNCQCLVVSMIRMFHPLHPFASVAFIGELERGVTNQREGHFPFMWNGKNMVKKVRLFGIKYFVWFANGCFLCFSLRSEGASG